MQETMLSKALIALTAGLLSATPASAWACDDEGTTPPKLTVEAARESALCLMNERRKRHGLRKLRRNASLEAAAQSHSDAMNTDDFFSHEGVNGSDPLSRIQNSGYLGGVGTWGIAENLGWGEGARASPRSAVSQWMNSSAHRHSMLSRRYREVGIGVAIGSPAGANPNAAIYTADFGYRK